MFKKIVLLLFVYKAFASNDVLRGCSVASNKKGSERDNFTLAEFHHNNPKKNEFFRISLIFPWKKPVIGVSAGKSSLNYHFGI